MAAVYNNCIRWNNGIIDYVYIKERAIMENLFWPITLGVPAVVLVVAVAVIFWALGQKKNNKLWKNEEHEGIIK